MYPVLHAVSLLMECPRPGRRGLAADVADALAGAPRLSIATRLGLVALATDIEGGHPVACTKHWRRSFRDTPERSLQLRHHAAARVAAEALPEDYLPVLLEVLSRDDEPRAVEALLACAPALREMAEALARRRDPYAVLPIALLELLASRLH